MTVQVRVGKGFDVHLAGATIYREGKPAGRRTNCGIDAYHATMQFTDEPPTCQRCRRTVHPDVWKAYQEEAKERNNG